MIHFESFSSKGESTWEAFMLVNYNYDKLGEYIRMWYQKIACTTCTNIIVFWKFYLVHFSYIYFYFSDNFGILTWLLNHIVHRICAGCNTEIGHGRYLSCMEAFWHPECFRCHSCNLPITDVEVLFFFWFRMYSSSWLILFLILVGYQVSSECCIQPNFHFFSVIVFNVRESSLSQTLLQGATSPKMWHLPEFCKFNFLLLFFVSAMLTFFSCFYSN